jgi:ABC-type lipoprotein release transport system permease subunit
MSAAFGRYEVVQFRVNARPSDIDSLARLRSIPTVLSAVLVGMVTVTVVNAMVVAVRRRRRDIAIFQTLGSTTGDVVTMGVWQGITIGTASLIFGIPLGIIGGRWLWTVLANKFGTLAEPVVPMPGVLVLAGVVMVLAATTGAIPVRRGLRHHPADVLRTE